MKTPQKHVFLSNSIRLGVVFVLLAGLFTVLPSRSVRAAPAAAPAFTSIRRDTPATRITNADVLIFRVLFSEQVMNVDSTDFLVDGSTTATVTNVTMVTARNYLVTVSGGDLVGLNGDVGLNLASGQDITNLIGEALPLVEPATDQTYLLDNIAPVLNAFRREVPFARPTNADTLIFRVSFDEDVINVDASDFLVDGSTTAAITSLTMVTNRIYNVTVSGGDLAGFNGVVGLNLGMTDITDLAGNALPIGEPITDQTYLLDNVAPVLNAFQREVPSTRPTNADTLIFRVSFDKNVTNVDASDFLVHGSTTATITDVTMITDRIYNVTVSGGDLAGFNGVVGLDLGTTDITDLADNALPAGDPSIDQTYLLDNAAPTITIAEPDTTPADSKTITASAPDGTLTMSNTTGVVCDGTLIFVAYTDQTFTSEADNGTRVCYRAVDPAGNETFSLSSAIAGIDIVAPTIAKSFGAATIPLNGTTTLSFTITNPNPTTALTGVAFTDDLPPVLVVTTPNGLAGSCGGGTITATPGSGTVSLSGATLAGNSACTFSVDVTGTLVSFNSNWTYRVTSTNGGTGNQANALLRVLAAPVITKAFGAASIPLNGTTPLDFTINNPNSSNALTGVAFTDSLPAGLVVATPNGLSGSCGGGTITATAGSGTVSLSDAALASNSSCTFSVNVKGMTGGVKNNSVTVSSTNGGTGNTSTASIMVDAPLTLISFTRQSPAASPTSNDTLVLRATFSMDVQNLLDATPDFTVDGTTTASVTGVAAVDARTYDVTVSGGDLASFNGIVGLNLVAGQNITDLVGNPLPAGEPATDETYIVDNASINIISGGGVVGEPGGLEIIDLQTYTTHFTQIVITFNADAYNPPDTTPFDHDDVNNPGNYQLIAAGSDGEFTSEGCGMISPNDTLIPTGPVIYSNTDGFVATVTVNGGNPLPSGLYRLYTCGSTSITDLAGNALNGGNDVRLDFRITDSTTAAVALPATGFAPNRVTALPEQTVSYTASDLWLEIPKLGVQMDIVGVPQVGGEWDVSWLGQDAGWLDGSAFPTWAGNSVLTGHVWNADNTAGPFRYINTLWYGDKVIVHAWGADYVYEVRAVQQVSPGNTAAMMKHEELPWVTLVTCRGYDEATGTYKYRVLVRAVLVEVK